MNHSLFIGRYAGIPVKIHWSFGFMVFFILFLGRANGLYGSKLIWFSFFIIVLFFCVILHEFGHALMAKRYRVETIDIIISPIGGLARLKDLPEKPLQELFIALAGPAVNVVIASMLALLITVVFGENPLRVQENFRDINTLSGFLKYTFIINVALFIFNLIPAFPMDGGRVLRAVLAMRLGRMEATKIASWIGKVLAVGFVILAIYWHHLLLGIIGFFIFSMAHTEYKQVRLRDRLMNTLIGQLAIINFPTVSLNDRMIDAIAKSKSSSMKNLLVLNKNGEPVAALPRLFIADAEKNNDTDTEVANYASSKLKFLDENVSVMSAKEIMQSEGSSIIGVTKNGQLHAVIDRDIIVDFMKS